MREITVQEAAAWLGGDQPPRLIDCREEAEHALCALPGSELIPLSIFAYVVDERIPDKSAPLLIYCHHGVRSAHVADHLTRLGYADVVSMAGGIDAWAEVIQPGLARY